MGEWTSEILDTAGVTPTGRHEKWSIGTDSAGRVTLRPSIGNFKGEKPHHAHYYITDNRVDWL